MEELSRHSISKKPSSFGLNRSKQNCSTTSSSKREHEVSIRKTYKYLTYEI